MKMLSIQEALGRKIERQRRIPELELHASGHCAHIGPISPGCLRCFVPDCIGPNFHLGAECNASCVYCFGVGHDRDNPPETHDLEFKARLLADILHANETPHVPVISFTGGGETLLNLDRIEYYMAFYRKNEDLLEKRPWYYLYTNGLLADRDTILRLKNLGINEIRFHLGASNFAQKVYDHMAVAVQLIDVITVETPAWPPHRQKLFEMLPRLETIGVKHLNLGEIQLTSVNHDRIMRRLPDAEVYQLHHIHLDDGGLVYDLMQEVVARGYSYSVLDCSSLVKTIQQAPGKNHLHEPVDGLIADHGQGHARPLSKMEA